jgi:hypothetical protein
MSLYDKMLSIDRRWIYLLVAIAVIIPLITGMEMKMSISPPAKLIYNKIENIPQGDGQVMISLDYDPSSAPELYPMTLALLRHCFSRDIKVILLTLWPNGAALAEEAVTKAAAEYNKKQGEDYVNLGYKAGFAIVILSLGESMTKTFNKDYNLNSTVGMPIFNEVKTLHDLELMVDLAAGASVEYWIAYGKERYKFDVAAGCTAVSATQYYPYLNSGQLLGLLGGLKGAAEYETMILEGNKLVDPTIKQNAILGMGPQSIVHLMTVIIVIFTNILYLIKRSKPQEEVS